MERIYIGSVPFGNISKMPKNYTFDELNETHWVPGLSDPYTSSGSAWFAPRRLWIWADPRTFLLLEHLSYFRTGFRGNCEKNVKNKIRTNNMRVLVRERER